MTSTIGDAAETNGASGASGADGPESAAPIDTPAPRPKVVDLPKPSRIERWGMNPEDRARVMEACLLIQRARWKSNFSLMMLMAVVVAIMGLSANSAAVVIGAMLIAPLMTPVLGIAASIAMALGPALVRSIITVVLATLGAIGLGYIAGLVPGVGSDTLSPQVLARTAPDIRDLFVAVAAGIAGSYATARPDVSSSLRRLAQMTPRVILGALVALAVLIGAGTLLTQRSIAVSNRNSQEGEVAAAVNEWLSTGLEVEDIEIDGRRINVEVVGPNRPGDVEELRSALGEIVDGAPGETVEVGVLWTQATRAGVGSRTLVQSDLPAVKAVVEEWLEADLPTGQYKIPSLGIEDDTIRIAVSSTDPQLPVADLQARVSNDLGIEPIIELDWNVISGTDDAAAQELAELRVVAQTWAADNNVSVTDVRFDGTEIDVELVGASVPPVLELEDLLLKASDGARTNIWFTERIRVIADRPGAASGAWWPPSGE